MTAGILIAVVLIAATAAVVFALVLMATALNRLALQRERQAAEALEAQRALVEEMQQLRRRLDSPVKVSVVGRVVTGRP